jgi:hypothetical protein
VDAERISWLVASTVVVAALQRALAWDGQPLFLVKGGVFIEFNLGLKARTTTDVDTLFRADIAEFRERLDEALAQPWGPFVLDRTEIEIIDAPKLIQPRRFYVRLLAKGAVWLWIIRSPRNSTRPPTRTRRATRTSESTTSSMCCCSRQSSTPARRLRRWGPRPSA